MSVEYEVIKRRLKSVIDKCGDEKGYIIYPFGEWGRMAKSVLNLDFGIQEKAIVDNQLSKKYRGKIEDDSYLDMLNDNEEVVLICSVKSEIHSELVKTISDKGVYFIDLFKEESAREAEEKINRKKYDEWAENWDKRCQERTLAVMEKAEKLGIKNNFYYHPKKTKSLFYLPYLFSDCIQQEIFLMDNYKDIDILNFVFKEFHDGDVGKYTKEKTVIDAGANIGNHTLYFMKEFGFARCYSFEPVKQTFLILQENIDINEQTGNVDCFCVGLGKSKMSASILNYNFTNIGGTNLIAGDDRKDGNIEIRALDSFTFDGEVKFIKIDVEGMEMDVVNGALKLIENNRPVIMVESFDKYNYLKEIFDDFEYSNISLGPNDYLFFPKEL